MEWVHVFGNMRTAGQAGAIMCEGDEQSRESSSTRLGGWRKAGVKCWLSAAHRARVIP